MLRQQASAILTRAGSVFVVKVLVQFIHHGLHNTGSVRCRGVAVDPALRVYNVADSVADAAAQMAALLEFGLERLHLRFGGKELDVVTRREAQMPAGEFIGESRIARG